MDGDTQVLTSMICLITQLQMGKCMHDTTAASTPAAWASMRSRRAGADRECRACLQCCLNPSSSTNRVTYPVRNLYNSTGTIQHMYHRTLHSTHSVCLSFQGQHKARPIGSSARKAGDMSKAKFQSVKQTSYSQCIGMQHLIVAMMRCYAA